LREVALFIDWFISFFFYVTVQHSNLNNFKRLL